MDASFDEFSPIHIFVIARWVFFPMKQSYNLREIASAKNKKPRNDEMVFTLAPLETASRITDYIARLLQATHRVCLVRRFFLDP